MFVRVSELIRLRSYPRNFRATGPADQVSIGLRVAVNCSCADNRKFAELIAVPDTRALARRSCRVSFFRPIGQQLKNLLSHRSTGFVIPEFIPGLLYRTH